MGSVLPLFEDAVFDPDAIHVMGEAFDCACRFLDNPRPPEIVREVMAKRIIEAARIGERDRDRLCERALQGVSGAGLPRAF